ncbi:PEP-CTERM sorting domain-containing protein [Roseateles sp. BYS78W]|uniref:PEP-CTERM sorting domain-containing protein n=1 Tax=Pelomonas candidula TaxID=3299025 RepID=A0ABW7HAL0_9BURK
MKFLLVLSARAAACAALMLPMASAQAGVVYGLDPTGLTGSILRWDAASHVIDGNERSLEGGLSYSLSGGSFEAFRDSFTWSGALPSVAAFTQTVQDAFAAWTSVDPVTHLGTSLSFVADLGTAVQGVAGGGLDTNGADIDLIATNDAYFWDPGNSRHQAETYVGSSGQPVTLTSGVANYANSSAISGVDMYINSNPEAAYTLDVFRRLLTHEIGHALGVGDAEAEIEPGNFIDDNFSAADPGGTLNNSWALLVNPLDPSGSVGLHRYDIGAGTTQLPDVNLLMESNGLGISAENPLTNLVPLGNDEYGTRQFLYPQLLAVNNVPEPGSLVLVGGALAVLWAATRRRRQG